MSENSISLANRDWTAQDERDVYEAIAALFPMLPSEYYWKKDTLSLLFGEPGKCILGDMELALKPFLGSPPIWLK